jgi:hypothetical protein
LALLLLPFGTFVVSFFFRPLLTVDLKEMVS